jgi:hypothetical protein
VPVTDHTHILNHLQRALGFGGCPTDAAWPDHLHAYACLPVAGVTVPGASEPGMLVGLSMADAGFPYTLQDPVDASMLAVLEVPAGNPVLVSFRCFLTPARSSTAP